MCQAVILQAFYVKFTIFDFILTNHPMCFQKTGIFETGLSDHHCLLMSCLKSTFHKLPHKRIIYRNMKSFDQNAYLNDINRINFECIVNSENAYTCLTEKVKSVIDKHATIKRKLLRGNNAPFMTKELRKAIMNRSRFRNRYNEWSSRENFLSLEKSIANVKVLQKKRRKTTLQMLVKMVLSEIIRFGW